MTPVALHQASGPERSDDRAEARGPSAAGGELEEQLGTAERRQEALAKARASGTVGVTAAPASYPAATDGGATRANTVIDTLARGPDCTSAGCYADFCDSGPALAQDANGDAGSGSTVRRSRSGARQRSTSPTTKKMLPRTAIRSGRRAPGSMAGMTETLENDAVLIFIRYGYLPPSPTR